MKRNDLFVLTSLLAAFLFVISLASCSHMGQKEAQTETEEGQMETVEGTVICLLPDYQKGTVKPVVADGPCIGLPPHQHVLLSKEGKVYFIQGLEEGLQEIGRMTERTNVKIAGRVVENPAGWTLFVQ